MLKRRSIRTKLIVALTLLSAIVLLLAFSGFWGLNRYRRLADAVSQRAMEIPYVNDLNRYALAMRESNLRSSELHSSEGMIHQLPLGDPLINFEKFEMDQFNHASLEFQLILDRYQATVDSRTQERSLLVDNERQHKSLVDVRSAYEALEAFRRQRTAIDGYTHGNLGVYLDNLVDETDKHLAMIHGSMADVSDDVRGQYRTWTAMAWFCTITAIAIMAVLLWSLNSLVVKPFRTLLDGSRLVAGGQFDHRIDLGTGDELSELAEAMNEMTDRFQNAFATVNSWCNNLDRQVQERTREVIQNEQLASVGFLAAGVAHEINNPLATIAWSSEALQSRVGELAGVASNQRLVDDELFDALTTNLKRIEDEAYRCKGITEKLLDFSRLNEVRRAPTDLSELVQDVVAMVGTVGKFRCKAIRTKIDGAVIAEVNPQEIRQVVLNLVTNALESVDHDGAVDVIVRGDDQKASIIVEDNGCGMSQEVIQHLFEPFFTRRRDGTGTGLGLSITYRIISQHGGSLVPFSEGEGLGSRMELSLPYQPSDGDISSSSRILQAA
ncbi:Sensor protein FixL [Rubripirellula tenax]|uniref:histidine kinase n=1 Tax=Rubripirellula tenax TaxID=2528015 RepID=A0A5C6EIF5_9BACT|nr:HAMP domain-containing sensor histidine kinase [Rubripirellula tenax]TWU47431.1 Sensor protein FixL [Rubripirellula tenax]